MEINQRNAVEGIRLLSQSLKDCSFVAVDLEMSGIDKLSLPANDVRAAMAVLTSLSSETYAEKIDILSAYSPMQIGVSTFHEVDDTADGGGDHGGSITCVCGQPAAAEVSSRQSRCACIVVQSESRAFIERECSSVSDGAALRERVESDAANLISSWARGTRRGRLVEGMEHFKQLIAGHTVSMRAEACTLYALRMYKRWLSLLTPADDFLLEEVKPKYRVNTFVAALFPSPRSNAFANISLNADTAEFLAGSGMDFNVWVRDGLRFGTEEEFRTAVRETVALQLAAEDPPVLSNKMTMPDSMKPLSSSEIEYLNFVVGVQDPKARMGLMAVSTHIIKLSRGEAPAKPIPGVYITDKGVNSDEAKYLRAINVQKANKQYVLMDTDKKPSLSTDYAVGMDKDFLGSYLMDAIVTATRDQHKPLVLFNGYTDLLFILRMLAGTLPPTLAEFKKLVLSYFPTVFDTRTLVTAPILNHISPMHGKLEATFKLYMKNFCPKFDLCFNSCERSREDPRLLGPLAAHNAAYDAFMTGCLFICCTVALRHCNGGTATPTTWEGILPMYGSVFYLNLNDATQDTLLIPRGSAIAYVVGADLGALERVRADLVSERSMDYSIQYNGQGHILSITRPHMNQDFEVLKCYLLRVDSVKSVDQIHFEAFLGTKAAYLQ